MSIQEIFKQLTEADIVVGDNLTELARRTGAAQPTLQKVFTGKTTKPWPNTVKALTKYYGITEEQLRGHVPIDYNKVREHLLPNQTKTTPKLDRQLLITIIDAIESWLDKEHLTLNSEKKAAIIVMLYDDYMEHPNKGVDQTQMQNLLHLAL